MEDLLMQNFPKSSPSTHKRHSLKYEECMINGEKIKLPQALCENTELFQVLFSVDSWNAFTEQQRRHLMVIDINNLLENQVCCKYSLQIIISSNFCQILEKTMPKRSLVL